MPPLIKSRAWFNSCAIVFASSSSLTKASDPISITYGLAAVVLPYMPGLRSALYLIVMLWPEPGNPHRQSRWEKCGMA